MSEDADKGSEAGVGNTAPTVQLDEKDQIYDMIVLGIIKQWRDSSRAALKKQARDLEFLSQVVDKDNG